MRSGLRGLCCVPVYDVQVPISQTRPFDSAFERNLHAIPVPWEPSLDHVYDVQVPMSRKRT